MRILIPLLLAFAAIAPAGAKPGDEIDRLIGAYYRDRPSPEATVHALVKVMEDSPDDSGVPKAFAWLIHNSGGSPESDVDMNEAFFGRIVEHHRDNPELANALAAMIGYREPEAIAFFEKLGDESKNELVSGNALLALASSFEHDRKAIERYDKILEKLIAKHPDLKYGNRDVTGYAAQKLFASQHLRIGKVAPEVEGEDADGNQFKLSDYRGKVVFFNFWGDW
jgi:hypothetical protein